MAMKHTIELGPHLVELLAQLPEDGMGYHLVDLVLLDGRVIKGQVILNGSCWETELEIAPSMIASVRKASRPRAA